MSGSLQKDRVKFEKPGTYKVRLTADGKSQTESFELIINPTEKWTKADTDARFDLWMKIREITENANLAIIDVLDVNKEVQEAAGSMKDKSAVTLAEKISKKAEGIGGRLVPVGKTLSEIANEPAKLLSKLQTVSHMLYSSEGRPPQSAYDVVEDLSRQIDTELSNWNKVMATDVAAFKKMQ